jgi:hypothetical protein
MPQVSFDASMLRLLSEALPQKELYGSVPTHIAAASNISSLLHLIARSGVAA